MIYSSVFQQRYLGLLNVGKEGHKRRESNHSSTKENTLICIRAGQASVTYNSASLDITHRDCYSALSTIHPHTSYFIFFSLLVAPSLFLYSYFSPNHNHCLPIMPLSWGCLFCLSCHLLHHHPISSTVVLPPLSFHLLAASLLFLCVTEKLDTLLCTHAADYDEQARDKPSMTGLLPGNDL